MARILLLIVLLIVSIWLLDPSVGQTPAGEFDVSSVQMPADELELTSFIFAVVLAASVGFLYFRLRVWRGNASKVFETSASKVVSNGLTSLLYMTGVITAIFIILMEYTGHHEDLLAVGEFLAVKGEKLINALIH